MHFKQRAVSILEVVISLLILSVGVLGAAQIQIHSQQIAQDALYRSVATSLAEYMKGLMEINSVYWQTYYSTPSGVTFTPQAYNECYVAADATGCLSLRLHQTDMQHWKDRVAATLPSGAGFICYDSTAGGGVSPTNTGCDNVAPASNPKPWIKVFWKNRSGGYDKIELQVTPGGLVIP